MSATLEKPYCTVEDVQAELQNTDADDAVQLIDSVNAASRWIEDYCSRDFWFKDCSTAGNELEVAPDWCAYNIIYLPWPVITLTKITVDDVEVPTTDYGYKNPQPGTGCTSKIYREGARWMAGEQRNNVGLLPERVFTMPTVIKLTGTFGFALSQAGDPPADVVTVPPPTLPQSVRRACTVIAAIWSGKSRKEIIDFSGNKQSLSQKDIPQATMRLLDRYIYPVV